MKIEYEYFRFFIEVSVVLSGNVQYSKLFIQDEVIRFLEIVIENKYFKEDIIIWMGFFLKYCIDQSKICDGESFMGNLKLFLNILQFIYFKEDIKFDQNENDIEVICVIVFMKSFLSLIYRKDVMLFICEDFFSKFQLFVYVVFVFFIFFEQYVVIVFEIICNFIIVVFVIFFVIVLFLVNLSVLFLVFFGFVFLIFELFGMMWLWNVFFNFIFMINLVMVIGFVVDYSVYVVYVFVVVFGSLVEKRVIDVFIYVGVSVLLGGKVLY